VLYCIVLYWYGIVLYWYGIVLYCIVLYCIVLYCIVLYCMTDDEHEFVIWFEVVVFITVMCEYYLLMMLMYLFALLHRNVVKCRE